MIDKCADQAVRRLDNMLGPRKPLGSHVLNEVREPGDPFRLNGLLHLVKVAILL